MFCERCGLNFLPKQSVCSRCQVAATRHWFQLMSLVTLLVAVLCNSLVGLLLLPRLAGGGHSRFVFRAWLWFDYKAALYGWVPIAIGLLAWDYLVWKATKPRVKGWVTRKLLTFRAAAGTIPVDDWEISGRALASGVERGAGRHSAPVHQRRIARLPAGSREGTKRGQPGTFVAGLDDDRGELVGHLLSGSRALCGKVFWLSF